MVPVNISSIESTIRSMNDLTINKTQQDSKLGALCFYVLTTSNCLDVTKTFISRFGPPEIVRKKHSINLLYKLPNGNCVINIKEKYRANQYVNQH